MVDGMPTAFSVCSRRSRVLPPLQPLIHVLRCHPGRHSPAHLPSSLLTVAAPMDVLHAAPLITEVILALFAPFCYATCINEAT